MMDKFLTLPIQSAHMQVGVHEKVVRPKPYLPNCLLKPSFVGGVSNICTTNYLSPDLMTVHYLS